MAEKKSLTDALERARKHSIEHPDLTVYVLDKPRNHTVVSTVEWVCRQRILEGFYLYCKFVNGERR